jgi:hypothetical protein
LQHDGRVFPFPGAAINSDNFHSATLPSFCSIF